MNKNLLFLILVSVLTFVACDPEENIRVHFDCEDAIEVEIIDASDIAGCQWILTSPEVDFVMEPINLIEYIDEPEEGKEFVMTYMERPDMASTCQMGRIIEINCIQ